MDQVQEHPLPHPILFTSSSNSLSKNHVNGVVSNEMGSTPTPLRDGLNINAVASGQLVEIDGKQRLRRGLAGLPAPRNDFEIVAPDADQLEVRMSVSSR